MKVPDGLDDAKVALVKSIMAEIETNVRRPVDQFRGFSTSPGAKST